MARRLNELKEEGEVELGLKHLDSVRSFIPKFSNNFPHNFETKYFQQNQSNFPSCNFCLTFFLSYFLQSKQRKEIFFLFFSFTKIFLSPKKALMTFVGWINNGPKIFIMLQVAFSAHYVFLSCLLNKDLTIYIGSWSWRSHVDWA